MVNFGAVVLYEDLKNTEQITFLMKVHMKHFQKNAISKILNNTHMEICPPENVKFPGIFNFPRALFKMYRS